MEIPLFLAVLAGAIAVLAWSANALISHCNTITARLQLSPVIAGLTLLAIGTSLPEIAISIIATWQQQAELAVGNLLGSNTSNIGLIFCALLMLTRVPVAPSIKRIDVPVLIAITVLSALLLWDLRLDAGDGLLMLAAVIGVLIILVLTASQRESPAPVPQTSSRLTVAMLLVPVLFGCLFGASKLIVWAASGLATELDISELAVGLTLIAIGSSLPELALSIAASLRRQVELVIGNLVGSNIMNLAIGFTSIGLIGSGVLNRDLLYRDLPVMLIFSTVFILALSTTRQNVVSRWWSLMVPVYFGYLFWIFT